MPQRFDLNKPTICTVLLRKSTNAHFLIRSTHKILVYMQGLGYSLTWCSKYIVSYFFRTPTSIKTTENSWI